jgi:hypothetical protein
VIPATRPNDRSFPGDAARRTDPALGFAGRVAFVAVSAVRVITRVAVAVVVVALAAIAGALYAADREQATRYDAVGPLVQSGAGDVVTLLHYFESGRHAVGGFVRGLESERRNALDRTLELARRAVVRVDFVTPREGSSTTVEHASGILVNEGRRVLTAGHAGAADANLSITVITSRRSPPHRSPPVAARRSPGLGDRDRTRSATRGARPVADRASSGVTDDP